MKIRLLTYNMHKGFSLTGQKYILRDIKKAIQDCGADIVFLQEIVGLHKMPNFEPQLEYLADQVWDHYAYAKNAIYTDSHHGNAILSHFPITEFINTSISTNRFEQRGVQYCKIHIPEIDQSIQLYNTHLDLLSHNRKKQSQAIVNKINQHHSSQEPLLLAGDFNDWDEKMTSYLNTELALKEAHLDQHGSHAATFPSILPFLKLDRIYFKNLKATEVHILKQSHWSNLSDHLPLLAEFEIA